MTELEFLVCNEHFRKPPPELESVLVELDMLTRMDVSDCEDVTSR